MSSDSQLNDIVSQLKEKVNALAKLSNELRSQTDDRSAEEIQADINKVLNEMSVLHEQANKLLKPRV